MSEQIKLNLSRPHSKNDGRRVCAVVGCRQHETPYSAPFCYKHDKDPQVHEALTLALRENKRGGDPMPEGLLV